MTTEGIRRQIAQVEGRPIAVRGDDVDTDRIIPARFLKSVTFEGLEAHAFEDDRAGEARQGRRHPFDDPALRTASILLVNRNFGCGSSREHAPQALMRWGIRAIVGESFAEIFLGNATTLGIPCLLIDREAMQDLMRRAEATPSAALRLSIANLTLQTGDRTVPAILPPAVRDAFLSGAWDATGSLLDQFDEVRAAASRLPYIAGF
jgi:3-isopropylmalate/(R)-2-methylmalate dehydratase small subunit